MFQNKESIKKDIKFTKINSMKGESSKLLSNGRRDLKSNQIGQNNSRSGYNYQQNQSINQTNYSTKNILNNNNNLSSKVSTSINYQSQTNNKRGQDKDKNIILLPSKIKKESNSEGKTNFNDKYKKYENDNRSKNNDSRTKSNQSYSYNSQNQFQFNYQTKNSINGPSSVYSNYSLSQKNLNINKNSLSQSNTLNSYKRSQNNDYSKKNIVPIKKNLENKKQLNDDILRTNSVSNIYIPKYNENKSSLSLTQNSFTSRSNTVLHSIIDIKNSPKKTYVLNVRKTDVIKDNKRHKKAYIYGAVDDNNPLINNANHKIYERRNVTKEKKTIADLPDDAIIQHRYNYNYDPNLSNTQSLSIDETNKEPQKEYALMPRKNDVIQTERIRKAYNVNEPQERVKKYTLYTKKYEKINDDNKNQLKNNKSSYDIRNNKYTYEPKINKKEYEPKYNKNSNEAKTAKNSYEIKSIKYNTNETLINKNNPEININKVTKENDSFILKKNYDKKSKVNKINDIDLKYNKNNIESRSNTRAYEPKNKNNNDNESNKIIRKYISTKEEKKTYSNYQTKGDIKSNKVNLKPPTQINNSFSNKKKIIIIILLIIIKKLNIKVNLK